MPENQRRPILRPFALLVVIASVLGAAACRTPETWQAPLPDAAQKVKLTLPADRIFLGPHILTMEPGAPPAQAVAIRGEEILAVGTREQVMRFLGPDTTLVELGERALLPGFIDAHGHFSFQAMTLGMANVASPPVGPVEDMIDLRNALSAFIEERQIPPGTWVLGMGYDDSLLREGRHPTRHDLDEVSTEHPILLMHVSLHLGAANSLALAKAGISADTQNPPGGVIRREADGRTPDGVLEETATYRLRGMIPPPTGPAALLEAFPYYASQGITTLQDGAIDVATAQGLAQLAANARLPLDVVGYVIVNDLENPPVLPAELPVGQDLNGFTLGGVKLVLDGSPQGKTAYLSAPYFVPPPGQKADYRGYPILPPAAVDSLIARFLAARVPILAHANGDAAAEILIDAVEKAAPGHDHRTVMIHAQTVRDDQLDRMAALAMVPSFFSAHVFYWGDWHRDSVLGPERGARISPTRSAKRRGIHFTVHNDAPVVPPDMMRLLWATVNRRTRSGQVLGAAQALTVEEALHAITLDAAYQNFDEERKGSLRAGKLADLVILERDPRAVPPETLDTLRVLETWSHGRRVYAAP